MQHILRLLARFHSAFGGPHFLGIQIAGTSKGLWCAIALSGCLVVGFPALAQAPSEKSDLGVSLTAYRAELEQCRKDHGGPYALPEIEFFLFGIGPKRAKLFYKDGALRDLFTGRELYRWKVKKAVISPAEYAVRLETEDGTVISLVEDEKAVWLDDGKTRVAIENTSSPVALPSFEGKKYPNVLRVLHQELLVNITTAGPVPNSLVYKKPWYRDGAMVALALKETGNVELLREWILALSEPFDKNNGVTEPDNLGQALYLISLVSDAKHPLVSKILAEIPRFEVASSAGKYIKGKTDGSFHPVYQTKWLKFGLKSLGLPDPYIIPAEKDGYSALFWMDYKDQHVAGANSDDRGPYPYLGWACDHFYGNKKSPLGNRDYPLTWEAHASAADYKAMTMIDPVYTEKKLSPPHTWHAAEAFLLLLEESRGTP